MSNPTFLSTQWMPPSTKSSKSAGNDVLPSCPVKLHVPLLSRGHGSNYGVILIMWLDEVARHVGLRPQFLGLNKAPKHFPLIWGKWTYSKGSATLLWVVTILHNWYNEPLLVFGFVGLLECTLQLYYGQSWTLQLLQCRGLSWGSLFLSQRWTLNYSSLYIISETMSRSWSIKT